MSGYGVSREEMKRIYDKVGDKGEDGIDRTEFLNLIRPLKRSVEALLKMMECNGFLLYEDCKEFRIYKFSIEEIEKLEEEELKKLRIQRYANIKQDGRTRCRETDEGSESNGVEDCRSELP